MTKAILKFDLSDPDDLTDFRCMSKARDMAIALWDIDQRLRSTDKHGQAPITREEFYEIVKGRGIDLDELS